MNSYSLSADELASLAALTRGSVRSRINSAHAAKLTLLGLARETADGYVITNRGRSVLDLNGVPLERFIPRVRHFRARLSPT